MEREVTIRYKPKSSHIYSKDSEATTHWQERTQDKDRDQGMKAKPVIGLQYRTEPKSLLPKATYLRLSLLGSSGIMKIRKSRAHIRSIYLRYRSILNFSLLPAPYRSK